MEAFSRKLITNSLALATMALDNNNIHPDIRDMLLASEQVIFIASQSRVHPGGSLLTPYSIYITNMRMLFKSPKWYGMKADILDINYKDIFTVMLKQGVFSTQLYFRTRFSNHKVKLPGLDKKTAQRINQLIQQGVRGELPGQNVKPNLAEVTQTPMQEIAIQVAEKLEPDILAENPASCRYCNCSTILASKFCHQCGMSINVETNILKACPACDTTVPEDSIFCFACHQKFPEDFLK
jgi:hypothetical protein